MKSGRMVAVWACALACCIAGCAGQGRRDVSVLLPENTPAVLKLDDLGRVYDAMVDSGFRDAVLREAGLTDVKHADEIRQWDRVCRSIKSLQLSFHGLHGPQGMPDVLLVADVGRTVDVRTWLPASVGKLMERSSRYAGTNVFQTKMPGGGGRLLMASTDGRLLAATDLVTLERTLDAMKGRTKRPLTGSSRYCRAMKNLAGRDASLYVSMPDLLRALEAKTHGWDSLGLGIMIGVLGLRDIDTLSAGGDYEGHTAAARLVTNGRHALVRVFAEPPSVRKVPAHLSAQTLACFTLGIHDGPGVWRRLFDFIARQSMRMHEADSIKEFEREFNEEAEKEIGFPIADAAAIIKGDIGFAIGKDVDEGDGLLFASVTDQAKARQLLGRIRNNREFKDKKLKEHRCLDCTVHAIGEGMNAFVWTIVDGVVLMSPRVAQIESAIRTRRGKAAPLGAEPGFQKIQSLLPARNNLFVYWNLGRMLEILDEDEAPPPLRKLMAGRSIGLALTVDGDTVEARLVQNKLLTLLQFWTLMKPMVTGTGFH